MRGRGSLALCAPWELVHTDYRRQLCWACDGNGLEAAGNGLKMRDAAKFMELVKKYRTAMLWVQGIRHNSPYTTPRTTHPNIREKRTRRVFKRSEASRYEHTLSLVTSI